jgi:flavin-dependent dehydrogenase
MPGFLHPLGGGHAVARPALDRACADAATRAGAIVRAGARMRSLAHGGNGWRIVADTPTGPIEIDAGYLVDATGRAAAIGRFLGATVQRAGDLVAALAWIPAAGSLAAMFRMLHVEAIAGGWVYAITVGDNTIAVGACARQGEHRRDRGGFLRGAIARSELLQPFATTPLPLPRLFPASPALTWPPSGPGWVAVGDAAAQLDPISGSGLRQGLETAFRAAELAMLPAPDRDAISPYYNDALRWMDEEHRRIRAGVYAEAADRLGVPFLAELDRYVSPEGAASR